MHSRAVLKAVHVILVAGRRVCLQRLVLSLDGCLSSVRTHQRTQVALLILLQILPAVVVDILTLEGGGLRTQPVPVIGYRWMTGAKSSLYIRMCAAGAAQDGRMAQEKHSGALFAEVFILFCEIGWRHIGTGRVAFVRHALRSSLHRRQSATAGWCKAALDRAVLLEIAHALRGSCIALCMMQLHDASINLRLNAEDNDIRRTMQRVHAACACACWMVTSVLGFTISLLNSTSISFAK